jgi:hypothetical protein
VGTRELRFLTLSYACAWQLDDVHGKVRITGTQDQVELAVQMCEAIMDPLRTAELDSSEAMVCGCDGGDDWWDLELITEEEYHYDRNTVVRRMHRWSLEPHLRSPLSTHGSISVTPLFAVV